MHEHERILAGGPALTVSTDQGGSFSTSEMRVLSTIPSPGCQTSMLNTGCGAARPACSADKLWISAPFGKTRANMTLSTGTVEGEWEAALQARP
jgi:hypothetical protein